MPNDAADALIIGGGPAGLAAATYLTRFKRRVTVIDAGRSRASLIPRSHNVPGFADGVEGEALLAALRTQARGHGAELRHGAAEHVRKLAEGFAVETSAGTVHARALLVATGVANVEPPIDRHDDAVRAGLIRYCPICDGYEVQGKRVALLGNNARLAAESAFMRIYTEDVTLIADSEGAANGISDVAVAGALEALSRDGDRVGVRYRDGREEQFDTLYAALGVRPQVRLAEQLGVRLAEDGTIETDDHQRTSVDGVFAAGDVVRALDQIAVAFGHAAIAATAMHHWLRERD